MLPSMVTVEISDLTCEGYLTFDLRDILLVLGEYAATLHWGVAEFEGIGELGDLGGHGEIDARIEANDGLWPIPWPDLWSLSQRVTQIWNGSFVGFDSAEVLGKRPKRRQWPATATAVIEAIDSSVWQVSTTRQDVIDALQRRFRCTKLV